MALLLGYDRATRKNTFLFIQWTDSQANWYRERTSVSSQLMSSITLWIASIIPQLTGTAPLLRFSRDSQIHATTDFVRLMCDTADGGAIWMPRNVAQVTNRSKWTIIPSFFMNMNVSFQINHVDLCWFRHVPMIYNVSLTKRTLRPLWNDRTHQGRSHLLFPIMEVGQKNACCCTLCDILWNNNQ